MTYHALSLAHQNVTINNRLPKVTGGNYHFRERGLLNLSLLDFDFYLAELSGNQHRRIEAFLYNRLYEELWTVWQDVNGMLLHEQRVRASARALSAKSDVIHIIPSPC
jgi:hypothetical protein